MARVRDRMTILRFCACFFLLLAAACGKKQKDIAARAAQDANQPGIALSQSAEVARATATNELPAVTNTTLREPAPVPGHAAYERGVALLRNVQRGEDLEAAIALFREAAEQGNAAAQRALGVCYFRGIGVAKNPAEAMAWLNKSVNQGDADAQFKLASILIRGDGVPADEPRAIELLRAAAQQGHAEAQYNLATLYSTGKGLPKDSKEAGNWFRKAAENGHPTAQSNLGVLHASG
jgi:TPR repeat protein